MRLRRSPGGLESVVLSLLWAAPAGLTTAEVVDRLDSDLAYTTVQTILTRLLAKGAVAREQVGRAHAYTAVLDEPGLAASRMHAVLDRSGDHLTVLSRFVGTLSADEEAALAVLLERAGQPGRQQDRSRGDT